LTRSIGIQCTILQPPLCSSPIGSDIGSDIGSCDEDMDVCDADFDDVYEIEDEEPTESDDEY